MLNEKTIELNYTLELVNYRSNIANRPVTAFGPSLQTERYLGFDAAVGIPGRFVFIQYKRAYAENGGFYFKINHTAQEDQHECLKRLESNGYDVWYILPLFDDFATLSKNRRRLLTRQLTGWYRPSNIVLPGGDVGRHLLHIALPTRTATVTSDPAEIPPPTDLDEFNRSLEHHDTREITVEGINRVERDLRRCFRLPHEGDISDGRSDVLDGLCALLV